MRTLVDWDATWDQRSYVVVWEAWRAGDRFSHVEQAVMMECSETDFDMWEGELS